MHAFPKLPLAPVNRLRESWEWRAVPQNLDGGTACLTVCQWVEGLTATDFCECLLLIFSSNNIIRWKMLFNNKWALLSSQFKNTESHLLIPLSCTNHANLTISYSDSWLDSPIYRFHEESIVTCTQIRSTQQSTKILYREQYRIE